MEISNRQTSLGEFEPRISDKLIQQTAPDTEGPWQPKDSLNFAWKIVNIEIPLMNELASYALTDAVQAIKNSKYYRHQVKGLIKITNKAIAETCEFGYSHMLGGREYLIEYCDIGKEHLDNDLMKLKYSISAALDRQFCPDSDIMTEVEYALILLAMSVDAYDFVCKAIYKVANVHVERIFSKYCANQATNNWLSVAKALYNRDKYKAYDDKNVQLAMQIICRKVTNFDTLSVWMEQAYNNTDLISEANE